jgi:hypothetical protein
MNYKANTPAYGENKGEIFLKKKIIIALSFVFVIIVSIAVGAYAASDIKLFINGKQINADLQIVDGSSYVPLRVVSESLGADVKWDDNARTISITSSSLPVAATPAPQGSNQSFPVNVNVVSGPMKMKVNKVTLDPAYKQYESFSKPIKVLILDVTVENTSADTVSWSPAYGRIVTNTKEQAQGYHYSDAVGGDFLGNVIKTGKLRFELQGDLSTITGFKYIIDPPISQDYEKIGEETTTEVLLK